MEVTGVLTCRGCGKQGTIVWEPTKGVRWPVTVSAGFYMLLSSSTLGTPKVVCERCQQIQTF